MLKGKQGRFRQNLLGKRVDYSGRSVIVVGPELKLHQCGLPKKMALELFKPFVMRQLVEKGFAHNIKSAKRIVERVRPEVWDVLEEVIQDHPVLLNRAPTLHRLGIQAFMPVLVEGSAIQIHPLVCFAFNADFDGDQMAVHVPLSTSAQREAKELMLSTQNLLSAADGSPVVSPTHDMVLGCYYLTIEEPTEKGAGKAFASANEAVMVTQLGHVHVQAPIKVELEIWDAAANDGAGEMRTELVETTAGRVIFNTVIPKELGFVNRVMDRKGLKALIAQCYRELGPAATTQLVDGIKTLGFHYATMAGITIGIGDIKVPAEKVKLLATADTKVNEIDREFRRGFITEDERYNQTVDVWRGTTDDVTEKMLAGLDKRGSVWMITHSGARGNVTQVHQLAGMRGLMADPSGRIIDLPIRSNLREGMSVLEYFISSHGARKGLADTALRTADSGYLTRRLVDVAQDVITREDDCGTDLGTWITREESTQIPEPFVDRLVGRMAALDLVDEKTGEQIVARNDEIDEVAIERIEALGIERVSVRSPLTCAARHGVCRMCYGRNLATGRLVDLGQAVGIIAAQSIGEPGTQLTMRTFHTGGVAGEDITQGLPRVEELFEARIPKGQAIMTEIDGTIEVVRAGTDQPVVVRVTHRDSYDTPIKLTPQHELLVANGDEVTDGQLLARLGEGADAGRGEVTGRRSRHQEGEHPDPALGRRRQPRVPGPALGAPARRDRGRGAGRPPADRGLAEPQGPPPDQGRGHGPALPGGRGPEGVPIPGRLDRRQARRDHRAPDAAQGDRRRRRRHRAAPERADRPLRVRGGQQPDPGRGRGAGDGADGAAGRDQGVAQHQLVPGGGLLPGDDPGAHRGRHQRLEGPPAGAQGERHHRQADPGRDRCRVSGGGRGEGARALAGGGRGAPRARGGDDLPDRRRGCRRATDRPSPKRIEAEAEEAAAASRRRGLIRGRKARRGAKRGGRPPRFG